MADPTPTNPGPKALDEFLRAQGLALHAKDKPPATRAEWERRRAILRKDMFQAMGPMPDTPCPLEAKILGELKRDGYRIEKLIFQSRPDVWVTASAYVPANVQGKVPGVLVVHGHWAWARIDPVVQSRCLGLVKLGFFVLAVDAFGAGERYTAPGPGTYHGALYGSTLWPTDYTLLGMQVYDNRRAVDYLVSRPEVDGKRLGITGASGGGNQTMYAGALDDRFGAVVPVCSVGTYQAYLHAACCVCEVLPAGLRIAEEGDVLSLVAPRALLVINAINDSFNFSPGEAAKSLERARKVFRLFGAINKVRHAVFDGGHAYNQLMREEMYGWMAQWLKDHHTGAPIPEPKIQVESPQDMRCYPDGIRPKEFLFPPTFAGCEGRKLVAKLNESRPDHWEQWESTAIFMREQLRKKLSAQHPAHAAQESRRGAVEKDGGVTGRTVWIQTEPGLVVPLLDLTKKIQNERQPTCVFLHLDGKAEAIKHPLAAALLDKGWRLVAPDLRGTGETRPDADAVGAARDHNSAEHALWLGRPLLGQWLVDVFGLLGWLSLQPGVDRRRVALAGVGPAGVVALVAAGLAEDRVSSVAAVSTPVTYVTNQPYGGGMRMGLLAPGILTIADVPHLAALVAPRKLVIGDGVTPQDQALKESELKEAFGFTRTMYRLAKAEGGLKIATSMKTEDIVAAL